MKQSDTERIKKIVSTWDALQQQLNARAITREQLLTDEFSQWAVLHRFIISVNRFIKSARKQKHSIPKSFGMLFQVCGTGSYTITTA